MPDSGRHLAGEGLQEEKPSGQPGGPPAETRVLRKWRAIALRRARAGDWLGAVTWQRALVLYRERADSPRGESSDPNSEPLPDPDHAARLDHLRLIRWEMERGGWREALEHIDRIAPRWLTREPADDVAGWLLLARTVAHFQLGAGRRFRRSLATVLRASRARGTRSSERSPRPWPVRRLHIAALETAWLYATARGQQQRASRLAQRLVVLGEAPASEAPASEAPASVDQSGPHAELHESESRLLRSLDDAVSARTTGRRAWSRLPEHIGGPRDLWPFLTAFSAVTPASSLGGLPYAASASPLRPGKRLLAVWQRRSEEDPHHACPAWLAPAIAGIIEQELPRLHPKERAKCEHLLTDLSVRTPEAFPRACVLRTLAECALWQDADDPPPSGRPASSSRAGSHPAQRLRRARTDLGLSAGLFRRLGMSHRAEECEERWAHLMRVRPAESGTAETPDPFAKEPAVDGWGPAVSAPAAGRGGGPPIRLADVRRRCAEAGFHTRDRALLHDLAPLLLISPKPLPILVTGESGTGKEVIARAIHRWSGARGDFVAIHCGAIPRDLLESELFGHVRGSFTGASGDKPGLVEAADGGTLFLDEIGEMSAEAQMKMLRVLETGEVRRVGDLRSRKVKVRLVAATHRDLDDQVARGSFRLDLLHRIRGYAVRLSPLRERPGDVPILVERLLAGALESALVPPLLSDRALAALLRYPWPGNVRELRAALLRAVYLAAGLGAPQIEPAFFGLPHTGETGPDSKAVLQLLEDRKPAEGGAGGSHPHPPASPEEVARRGLDGVLADIERRLIVEALDTCEGNRTRAAKRLGNISRTTLLSKMKRLGIE